MSNIYNKLDKKVSVIIPVYNSQKTLSRCIESLLGQTYPLLEIILVNDGSLDDSLVICRAYEKDYKNIVVVDKLNGGVSSARNAGIDRASGYFIMFVDSDDWVEPDYCEMFVRHFEKESLVFSTFSSDSMDTGDVLRISRDEALLLRGAGIESPCSKIFETAVIRREFLKFPEGLSLGEDFIFVLRYLSSITGDLLRLEYSAYHYERQEDSLSKKIPSLEQTELFYEQISEAVEKLNVRDSKSYFIRDRSCMLDFEKLIVSDAQDRSSGFVERYRRIRRTMSSKVYKDICYAGVESQNKVYEFLYKKRMAFLLNLYFACKDN